MECFSDIPVSVLSKLNLTEEKSYCNGNETESCQGSQSGMTSEHSMVFHGKEKLTACSLEAHAKGFQPVEQCSVSPTTEAVLFPTLSGLYARLDLDTSCWKMSQGFLFDHLEDSLEIWPSWASTRGMVLSGHVTPGWIICGNDYGWLRTPCKSDGKKWYVSGFTETQRKDAGRQPMLIHQLIEYHGLKKGWANPEFWELMMDWPIGWTDLNPLEMGKFQQWLNSHGKPSHSECHSPTNTMRLSHL